jgi:uncharacterized protein
MLSNTTLGGPLIASHSVSPQSQVSTTRMKSALWFSLQLVIVPLALAEDRDPPVGLTKPPPNVSANVAGLVWLELFTTGIPAEEALFYQKTLGWNLKVEGKSSLSPVVFFAEGEAIAGISYQPAKGAGPNRSGWVGCFVMTDLAAQKAHLIANGGQVLLTPATAPTVAPDRIFALDPEGAIFGLASSASIFSGYTSKRAIWPVLLAKNPVTSAQFYAELLGGVVKPEKRTPLFSYDFLLGPRDSAPAWAAVSLQPGGGPAAWLFVIAVPDLDATVRRAKKAGARVLRPPTLDLIGGRVAVLSTLSGAVFGLAELVPKSSSPAAPRQGSQEFEVELLSP